MWFTETSNKLRSKLLELPQEILCNFLLPFTRMGGGEFAALFLRSPVKPLSPSSALVIVGIEFQFLSLLGISLTWLCFCLHIKVWFCEGVATVINSLEVVVPFDIFGTLFTAPFFSKNSPLCSMLLPCYQSPAALSVLHRVPVKKQGGTEESSR